ncbi:MAG: hypothetical protein LBI58_05625 [Tannerellaceae bacterium]|nr:hypothetical protein [Tannerellaceae bacterium]
MPPCPSHTSRHKPPSSVYGGRRGKYKPGKYTSEAGKYTIGAGKYTIEAGKYTSEAGKYTSGAGKYTIEAGKYTSEARQSTISARQSTGISGISIEMACCRTQNLLFLKIHPLPEMICGFRGVFQ